jgi:zinc finger HIT domain-containing protein 1
MDKRTNPTDIPNSSFVPGNNNKTPQNQQIQADQKRKQPANVRKVLYARKTLKDWLEELVSLSLNYKYGFD